MRSPFFNACREDYLLESDKTTIRIREFIATTVCHELGHQWTGNLVTLDWWSNTWLNEGFATYFESIICNEVSIREDVLQHKSLFYSTVFLFKIFLRNIKQKFQRIN